MIAATEVHHAVPQCLLRLHDEVANGGHVEARIEFTLECERWRVPVSISRQDLEALVERSVVVLEREKHRLLHRNDFARWGARGGRRTLSLYGTSWFSALALRRWGRISREQLEAARPVR